MKNLKTIGIVATIIGVFVCDCLMNPAKAADTYSQSGNATLCVNTATTTNLIGTNLVIGGITKGQFGTYWTNSITVATTNLTLIQSAGTKDLALQFQANLTATNSTQTYVLWGLARSVSGGSPTNAAGSNLLLEQFAVVTNTIPINSTASPVVVVNLTSIPTTPANVNILSSFNDGAIPDIYIYSITPPASSTVTNATVYSLAL